ncbi:MAG: T9SS type A sorting domain-containing protein [Flavobacteriales bacterium]|nr:T9SS type A sorting domain-containing protein [Flavobacteriales bacterium]MCB9363681.1 T9SS type A sorting domain-containing protein [Flavobacteriales bacterium]
MKKLLFILLGGLLVLNVNAQTLPVAVNDTFYTDYENSRPIFRNNLIDNDDDVDGDVLVVDTLLYNGTNQITTTYYTNVASWLRLNKFIYTPLAGYFGLDSLKYLLTDTLSAGFDTATIYIYVKRKEYEYLDLNNIRAHINNNCLFQDRKNSISAFNVPKQINVYDPYYSTIFGANLWVAGEDINGQVRTFAPMVGGDAVDGGVFLLDSPGDAGPISNEMEFYSYKWDRVWKVSQTDIDYHIANYNTPGYQPIEVIENWPAHGDTSKGQALYLASFVDIDNDGVYNPLNGDYPKIKGQQAVYFIKNDKRIGHTYSSSPLGLEVHGMAYAYNCPSDSAINHTVFLNYKIYNRSASTYTNVYTGMWTDFDIGCSGDDYVGCDVARGAFYGYNGDIFDEDGGVNGYGTHPPAQGVVILKGPKANNDGIDNPFTTNIPTALAQEGIPYAGLGVGYGDGIVDNEYIGMKHFLYYDNSSNPVNGEPHTGLDFYNYMQGKWKAASGSPQMSWGGDGTGIAYGVAGAIPTKYMFPGNSDPLFWSTEGVSVSPWSEETENNTPTDRRGLGSTGPFTMQPGDMKELDLAFVFGRDYQTTGNMAGVVVMQERIDSIRSYYLDGFQSVCGGTLTTGISPNEMLEENKLQVYPNPFYNQFIVNYELENTTAQLLVFNMYGKLVSSQVIKKSNTLIDLSHEASGIYFVQITDGSKSMTKKMVKQ